jgi:Uracil-DNA glycosylase
MIINIKSSLEKTTETSVKGLCLTNLNLDADSIHAIMINEVVPANPTQDFYGGDPEGYLKTVLPLFQKAGVPAASIHDILSMGIYLTNAVKTPKSEYTIETDIIKAHLSVLEEEISLFPNIKVIMLMGDVAKKAFNMISKKNTKKNVIPAISTYKLRDSEFYYNDIRVIPSYIMTGGNILIEKSKFEMASEDIRKMMALLP